MNRVSFLLSAAGFLVCPPVALAVRYLHPRRLPWWGVALAIAFGGWLFANAGVHFYYEHLGDLLRTHPSDLELRERWEADGAKRVFALFFGWVYGLVYAAPFLPIFGAAHWWRSRRAVSSEHAA
jgi:hypothetical protein